MPSFRAFRSVDVRHIRKRHLLFFMIALLSFCLAPDAQLLENTASTYEVSLTCTFSEDISKREQKFQIVDEQQDNALNCRWRERLFCTVKDGYTYDWKLSDTVTVRKVLSQEPAPATCSCFLVGHDDTSYERPCDVTVSVPEFNRAPSKESERQHSEDTPSRDSTTRQSEDSVLRHLDSQNDALIITAVVLSVGVTLLAILTVIATFIYKRYSFSYRGVKKYLCSQCNSGDPGDTETEKKSLRDSSNA